MRLLGRLCSAEVGAPCIVADGECMELGGLVYTANASTAQIVFISQVAVSHSPIQKPTLVHRSTKPQEKARPPM